MLISKRKTNKEDQWISYSEKVSKASLVLLDCSPFIFNDEKLLSRYRELINELRWAITAISNVSEFNHIKVILYLS